jgi:hypothetical protein
MMMTIDELETAIDNKQLTESVAIAKRLKKLLERIRFR